MDNKEVEKVPDDDPEPTRTTLRGRAEAMLRTSVTDVAGKSASEVQQLVHELQVHQMELQIQNEELRTAQIQLAHSRDRYSDLYEFAPVGYLTMDARGVIQESNLTASAMLRVDRKRLAGRKFTDFIDDHSQDDWHLHRREVFSEQKVCGCDLQMVATDRTPPIFHLQSLAFPDQQGVLSHCRTALSDETERRLAHSALGKLNIDLNESLCDTTDQLDRNLEQLRLLSEAVSHLGEGVLITSDDRDWPGPTIIFVNEAVCRITGYDADELIGSTPRILQGEATDTETAKQIKRDLNDKGSCVAELVNCRKDGTPHDVEWFITPLFDSAGRRTHFVSIQRDITERKAVEEELRREHEFNRKVIETGRHVILVLDTDGRIVQFNPYLERISGWRSNEVKGRDWFETFIPDSDQQLLHELFAKALAGHQTQGYVNSILTKDGQQREIEWYDAPLVDRDGSLAGLLATGQDVTERRALERHILEIASEEQRRIGNDLHDGVGQELTGLSMISDSLAITLGRESRSERETVEKIQAGIKRALAQVRALSRGLNPVDVDAHGLMSALSEMTARLRKAYSIRCEFRCNQPVLLPDNQTATQLYRIAQEATTNAIRHAKATQITVSLETVADAVILRIIDDGTGMTAKPAPEYRNRKSGMGLRTMSYRAGIIHGELSIHPLEVGGTEVVCTVPVVSRMSR